MTSYNFADSNDFFAQLFDLCRKIARLPLLRLEITRQRRLPWVGRLARLPIFLLQSAVHVATIRRGLLTLLIFTVVQNCKQYRIVVINRTLKREHVAIFWANLIETKEYYKLVLNIHQQRQARAITWRWCAAVWRRLCPARQRLAVSPPQPLASAIRAPSFVSESRSSAAESATVHHSDGQCISANRRRVFLRCLPGSSKAWAEALDNV